MLDGLQGWGDFLFPPGKVGNPDFGDMEQNSWKGVPSVVGILGGQSTARGLSHLF